MFICFKCIGVVFFVYTLIGLTEAQEPLAPTSPYSKLTEHFYNKCLKATQNPKIFDKLYYDAGEFKRFLQLSFQYVPKKLDIFCSSERQNLEKRMVEISNDLRPCLGSNERFLADFIATTFKEFMHFLCHNDGSNLNSFFHSSGERCRNNLLADNSAHPVTDCFSAKMFKPLSGNITQKEACDDLTTAKKCFSEVLEQRCSGKFSDLNEELFRYITKPCSGCVSYLSNTLLLLISIFVTYLFSN